MMPEPILWQGRPEGRVPLDAQNPGRILFGFIFIAFSMVWMDRAMTGGSPIWPAGLIFLALGLRFGVWQPWLPRLRARFAQYTLTSHRAVAEIRWPVLGLRRQEMTITPATIIDIDGEGDGPGTLTLRQTLASARGSQTESLRFDRIAEPRRVLALMRDIQKGAA